MAEALPVKSSNGFTFNLKILTQHSDIAFAFGIILIMVILIMPMPSFLMDLCFSISITLSVLILMTSLFIVKPLEFSSFPTVLLVSTMIRLALNVASTRLILSHGHEGLHAAGKVIAAFGEFAMGGNFVIGLIVFAILIIVNFVVITKGSGRIAEVSARFSLDAMPGKQMAIDADLSAGLINETEAKLRRKELESESNFYGSMDGAAKFVRGDAIAGLLITFINIIGGVIIGIAQNNMDFMDAMRSYTILTVGDGLVTQIPALIVSTAAGLLVSKGGIEGTTDRALFGQLSAYPSALGMSAFLSAAMAFLPGIPMFPFMLLAALAGSGSWFTYKSQKEKIAQRVQEDHALEERTQEEKSAAKVAENLTRAPAVDVIRIELGLGLLPLVNSERNQRLTDQIRVLRQTLANDMGIILPSVRLQDNMQLPSNHYIIRIKEMEAGRGELRANQIMVMDPRGNPIQLSGEEAIEPSFGLKAMWIPEHTRKQAEKMGYTLVEAPTVLTTHLSEIVKDNVTELLSYADTQHILENLSESYKKLLNDIVPGQISVGGIQRILQNLIGERVSIRDLNTILEGIAEGSAMTRNLTLVTEHVRLRLMRQISFANADSNGQLTIFTLSSFWEQNFNDNLIGDYDNRQLAMPPSMIQDFINKIRQSYDRVALMGETPVLITSAAVRPFVRSILDRARPSTIIISQAEVHPKVKIRNLGQV